MSAISQITLETPLVSTATAGDPAYLPRFASPESNRPLIVTLDAELRSIKRTPALLALRERLYQ